MSELVRYLRESPLVKRVFVPSLERLGRRGPHLNIELKSRDELRAALKSVREGKITLEEPHLAQLEEIVKNCNQPRGGSFSAELFRQHLQDEFKATKSGLISLDAREMDRGGVVWELEPEFRSPADWTKTMNRVRDEQMRSKFGMRQYDSSDIAAFKKEFLLRGSSSLKEAGAKNRKALERVREGVRNVETAITYLNKHHGGELQSALH